MLRYFISAVFLATTIMTAAPSTEGADTFSAYLPQTTKGFLATPNAKDLRTRWEKTQLGQLARDPKMAPFAKDFQRQMLEKLNRAGVDLGLEWADLEDVASGELCMASIQPENDPQKYALAVIADTTGNEEKTTALLAKIEKNHLEIGAKKTEKKVGEINITIFQLPKKIKGDGENRVSIQPWACYFVHEKLLVAADNEAQCTAIASRMGGTLKTPALNVLTSFKSVMEQTAEKAGSDEPQIRWFIEPFGLFEVLKAQRHEPKKRGKDLLKIIRDQGFSAVQGVGGYVYLVVNEIEITHYTMVYAPPVEGAEEGEKYTLAARMLEFPNTTDLTPDTLIPRELATYLTFNWKMQKAFSASKTLVNAIAGDEIFDQILNDLRDDPNGPMIDIPNNFVAHLSERVSLLTDYNLPITPQSERMLGIIPVNNADAVAKLVDKAMKSDPNAKLIIHKGQKIWEISNEPEEDDEEIPTLVVSFPGDSDGSGGFDPLGGGDDEEEEEEEEEEASLPSSAVTVLTTEGKKGYLMISTHVDFLKKILDGRESKDTLADSADFIEVQQALKKLGSDEDSFRYFSRTDEEFRPTYELIRQGKMPESESLLGKILNRMLGSGEKNEIREQQIDGSKLPDYQVVRRYLGPAGLYVNSRENGWFVTGVMLPKR